MNSHDCFQEDTLDSAVSTMTNKGVVQPVLLRVQSRYYVKVDSAAIPILDCSCFAEAVEFCFMCFFVFDVYYPSDLRVFYAFLEFVYQIKSSIGKSSTLSHFTRALKNLPVEENIVP